MDKAVDIVRPKRRKQDRDHRTYQSSPATERDIVHGHPKQPAAYGTIDGDGLVKNWLERMEDSPVPRAKLSNTLKESTPTLGYDDWYGPHQADGSRGGKRARAPKPAPPCPSPSPDIVDLPPSPLFAKRPRHKTRADKYEVKQARQGRPRNEKSNHPKRRTEESSKRRLGAEKDIVNNFASAAILNERLTLQPASAPGLFQNGHMSVPKPLMDLSFNSMNFLSRPRDRPPQVSHSKENKKRKREVREASAFFGTAQNPDRGRNRGNWQRFDGHHDSEIPDTLFPLHKSRRDSTPAGSRATTYVTWSPSVPSVKSPRLEPSHLRDLYPSSTPGSITRHTGRSFSEQGHRDQQRKIQREPRRRRSHLSVPADKGQGYSPIRTQGRVSIVRYEDKGVEVMESGPGQHADFMAGTDAHRPTSAMKITKQPVLMNSQATQTSPGLSRYGEGAGLPERSEHPVIQTTCTLPRSNDQRPSGPSASVTCTSQVFPLAKLPERLSGNAKSTCQNEGAHIRSSSPGYVASLEQAALGHNSKTFGTSTSQDNVEANAFQPKETPQGQAIEQQLSCRAQNTPFRMRDVDLAPNPREIELAENGQNDRRQEALSGPQKNAPNPRYPDRELSGAQETTNIRVTGPQMETMDTLVSRVDRELAQESAFERLSNQVFRETSSLEVAAPSSWVEQEIPLDDFPIDYDAPLFDGIPAFIDYEEAYIEAEQLQYDQPDEDEERLSDFWRPNMFM